MQDELVAQKWQHTGNPIIVKNLSLQLKLHSGFQYLLDMYSRPNAKDICLARSGEDSNGVCSIAGCPRVPASPARSSLLQY